MQMQQDIQLGKTLGSGKTSEIYDIGNEKVVKLFFKNENDGIFNYEANIMQTIIAPWGYLPHFFGVTKIENRNGIILEKIIGKNLLDCLVRNPWKVKKIGRSMAHVHSNLNNTIALNISDQKLHLIGKIKLSSDLLGGKLDIIIEYTNKLPSSNNLCHGDFHPQNIISSPKGYVVLDWGDAYAGNKFSDVARTFIIFNSPHLPRNVSSRIARILLPIRNQLCSSYLKEYMNITKSSWLDIQPWILPIAAARLEENIPDEQDWLLQVIDSEIANLRSS